MRLGHMAQQLRGAEGSGLNEHIRRAMRQNPDYGTNLDAVLASIASMAMNDLSFVQIAVNCKWGKHRSVSFGEDLASTLAVRGFIVGLYHLEQPRWDAGLRARLRMGSNRGFAFPFASTEEEGLLGTRVGRPGQGVRPRTEWDAPRTGPIVWFRVL